MAVLELFLVAGWIAIRPNEPAVILANPIIGNTSSTVMMVTDPQASVTTLILEATTIPGTTAPTGSSQTTRPSVTGPTSTAPTSTASTPTTVSPTIDSAAEQTISAETDFVRMSRGLFATVTNSGLVSYARDWALHMAATGVFAHSDIEVLLSQGWEVVGENIAQGADAGTVTDALVSSPAHLSVILNPAFTSDGTGVAVDSDGELWVVQIFAGEEILPVTTTTIPVTIPPHHDRHPPCHGPHPPRYHYPCPPLTTTIISNR